MVASAYFEYCDGSMIGINTFSQYQGIYAISTLIQIVTVAIWILLIMRAALKTGEALRKEPFLSTRPAQLVFRILMSMLFLAATSVIVLSVRDMHSFYLDYSGYNDYSLIYNSGKDSVGMLFRVMLHVNQRIPYISTSATVGAGEILFVTVCTLTLSFIFLPSTEFILSTDYHQVSVNNDIDRLVQKENQRRDKRTVIGLGRNTHTWRAFPSPIERHGNSIFHKTKMARFVEHYEVDKHLQLTLNQWGPGTIYKNNYTAVFCIETALWLLECSWQTCKSSFYPI